MYRVIIFGGTTEGRLLAEFLASNGVHVKLCVATEHGADLINKLPLLDISTKRLEQPEMIGLIEDEKPNLVIDGTHPYAQIVTENAYKACKATGEEYMRLRREDSHLGTSDSVIYVDSIDEAVEYINGLEDKDGRILTLTGSKELRKYTGIEDYESRVVARVLSTAKVAAE
ncbi:MAG: precorrin-6A/cobalt-precorrin-6A reductase, partial [Bacillota bacterium]|nr:precorrin-6A/cobalt-precorrin-6A reductase [Bacillota bacterium]